MDDIRYWRAAAGVLPTSIPQRHTHHAPTGFEIGFAGSGPADFSLNILALALPLRPRAGASEQTVRLWDGTRVSMAAWALHQRFKEEVLAHLPWEVGTIRGADIEAWLDEQRIAGGKGHPQPTPQPAMRDRPRSAAWSRSARTARRRRR